MDLTKSPMEGSSWDEDDVWERKQALLDEIDNRPVRNMDLLLLCKYESWEVIWKRRRKEFLEAYLIDNAFREGTSSDKDNELYKILTILITILVIVLLLQKKKITEEHRTEDPIPEISIDMSREVTLKDLSEITQAIGSEWKLLGAALGITEVEMEHIDCDNKATPMKIFSMLTKWRRENDATVNTLYNAIQNCRPAVTFDMKVIKRVFAQRN